MLDNLMPGRLPQAEYVERTLALQAGLKDNGLDLAILTDPDSVTYFGGFWNYLGMDFGRPTILLVARDRDPILITPLMELEMAQAMSWVADIRPWADGVDGEWNGELERALRGAPAARMGIEKQTVHARIAAQLEAGIDLRGASDLGPITSHIRMRKSASEIATMREAGTVAIAMVEAAKAVIATGVPEYEVALAVLGAGTRSAAFLLNDPQDRFVSPTIYNLQIMQSGHDTSMVHRRSSIRCIGHGDPVYLCFCGIANFRNYKLGFDREFFVGDVTDEQARTYETAVSAQQTALAAIRPGVTCEHVNAAAEAVYREAGFGPSYRTGRSIGYSFLELPELKRGDTTIIEPGMTFAVDGGVTVPGRCGGRVGDSIVVTDTGFDYLTPYPRELTVL